MEITPLCSSLGNRARLRLKKIKIKIKINKKKNKKGQPNLGHLQENAKQLNKYSSSSYDGQLRKMREDIEGEK